MGKSCSVADCPSGREDLAHTHRQILKLNHHPKKHQTRKDNGLYSREARDRREEAEEGGEEGRDGAVQEAQACPPQHQQQGKDLQAGNYNQSQN